MRPDVAALRESIDARLRGKAAFSEEAYGDTPILFTARTLKSYVPEPLAEARTLARNLERHSCSEAEVFWQQAQLLAEYEDVYDFRGHFSRYYPTYEVMNNDQLRGYFAWRTRWRSGEDLPTETSFVYVLAYELLHGVGVKDAQAGYHALCRLRDGYAAPGSRMYTNLSSWIDGYVVYWGLSAELLDNLSYAHIDSALGLLLALEEGSSVKDEQLFVALSTLSSYRIESSALYKRYPAAVQAIVCAVWRGVVTHHAGLKRGAMQTYFGTTVELDWRFLPNAVFADPLKRWDYCYEVSPLDHIYCKQGRWSRSRYVEGAKPNKKLGSLLKTIDALMRQTMSFEPSLEAPLRTKYVEKLVVEGTRSLLAAQEEARRREVHIDVSLLGQIRAAADITRDRLIVEDTLEEVPSLVVSPPANISVSQHASGAAPAAQSGKTPSSVKPSTHISPMQQNGQVAMPFAGIAPFPVPQPPLLVPSVSPAGATLELADDERALLVLLLEGSDVHMWSQEHHQMPSVAIEHLNEVLMDVIGDVAIDAGAEPPEVYEDYKDDVRELLYGA